jgi:formiminoglutamase
MQVVDVVPGPSPVILAFPHVGTRVPAIVLVRLNDAGRRLADTDWHVDRLYAGLLPGATTVTARVHRYVIDLNRDPAGGSLYPGQNTTGLVPLTDFDGAPIWQPGAEPTEADIADRVDAVHTPYHAALAAEVARVKAMNGIAVVFDCHSIRSRIPFLFEGLLPDLNIGTDGGRTCDPAIERAAVDAAASAGEYTHVLNGRFRGGWTTRHYGRPASRIHAIQLELAQATHLATEAPPFAYDPARADRLRPVLADILARIETAARALAA